MLRSVIGAGMVVALTGCAPYIYKSEINAFSSGVDDLAGAYRAGTKTLGTERAEQRRLELAAKRPDAVLAPECEVGDKVPAGGPPCSVLVPGSSPRPPSPVAAAAGSAAPLVAALRAYADALAAVTNAEDAAQLDAAQSKFYDSVEGLLKSTGKAPAAFGPLADLASLAFTQSLNRERYKILRAGVQRANEPVSVLGDAMGEALATLRVAQTLEMRTTASLLTRDLGTGLSARDYGDRLAQAETKTAALEAVRRADPRAAAADMVRAHQQLYDALQDNTRQGKALVQAVQQFSTRAKAVREAFQGGGKDG